MKALVVNCSPAHYNLGARKLSDWLAAQGHAVSYHDGDPGLFGYGFDLVALSVIFSWHAARAREIALRLREQSDVWCGGPGMFALGGWWLRETGLTATRGLDPRFERQQGGYRYTFASRGCPVGCSFCIVPRLEGTEFTLYPDFEPAPVLCDNNLSALPEAFQRHIIDRYTAAGVRMADANSGFEPATFDEGTYRRWAPLLHGPWRFALDEMGELAAVERMMGILREVRTKKKQVYVLIGNEPVAACYERAMRVLEWGGEPFCQPYRPLNALDYATFKIAHDWTSPKLRAFARYFNRHLYRYCRLWEYARRPGDRPLFRESEVLRD